MAGLKRILNLGSGDDTYGTDRFDLYPTKATTKVGNIESGLPYDSDIFDQVYSRYNLEHIKNIGEMIEEAKRVLKPGGDLYVITDNAWFWRHPWGISRSFINHPHGPDDRHYGLFLPIHLRNFLESAGFEVTEAGFMNWTRRVDKMMKRMGGRFSRMGAQSVYVRGKKPRSSSDQMQERPSEKSDR